MLKLKNNRAIIFSERSASTTSKILIDLYDDFEPDPPHYEKSETTHQIIENSNFSLADLGSRQLFMSVRNPYERFVSWFRIWASRRREGAYPTLEQYLAAIENNGPLTTSTEIFDTGGNTEWPVDVPFVYVTPMSSYLKLNNIITSRTPTDTIPLNRINVFVRYENLYDDLLAVGYDIRDFPFLLFRQDFLQRYIVRGRYHLRTFVSPSDSLEEKTKEYFLNSLNMPSEMYDNYIAPDFIANPNAGVNFAGMYLGQKWDRTFEPEMFPDPYDQRIIDIVNASYADDFTNFGYQML